MTPIRLRSSLVIGYWSLVISSAAMATGSFAIAADDAALRPVAFQNGVNQQSLGAETTALARAIDDLIEELQRNGFPVQSLAGLSELAAQLNALGGTEMASIAARLRSLGESARADPRATATEAYLAQQAIETRLKTLARQISVQQLREEIARRLEALIARQLAAQRETRAIASAKPDAERHRLLESDQSGIGDDLLTFFQTGENLLARLRETSIPAAAAATTPAASDDGAAPAAPQTFAERINGPLLTTLSNEAESHLEGKRYPDAFARQEALLAELRKIHQGILSSQPKDQRLAGALQQVSALRQQEEARDQTRSATPESRQAAADQARTLANQVAPLSPEAAAALQQAAQAAAPQTPPDPQTPPATTTAAQALAQAEAALQTALAQARQQEAGAPAPGGRDQQAGQPPAARGQQQARPQPSQQQQQGPQLAGANADTRSNETNGQGEHRQGVNGSEQGQMAGSGPDALGPAQTTGALRREEREAFTALQGERYPAEYSAWVQQYWRNLAQDQ